MTGATSDAALGADLGLEPSTYEGPTGIQTVIHLFLEQEGFRVASLSGMTPFYLAIDPSPQAIAAIAERKRRAGIGRFSPIRRS